MSCYSFSSKKEYKDKLVLKMTGICRFSPDNLANPRNMWVLMPDLRSHHPRHFPALVCRMDQLETSRAQDHVFLNESGDRMALFWLTREDLTVGTGERDNLAVHGWGVQNDCPTKVNAKNFGWVVPMGKISKGSHVPKLDCVKSTKLSSLLVARLRLGEGKLQNSSFARDGANIVRWEFKLANKTSRVSHEQAISEEVECLFELDSGKIEINSRYFDTSETMSDPRDPIKLNKNARDHIEVSIKNVPPAALVCLQPEERPRGPELHYQSFYKLSKGSFDERIPFPTKVSCQDVGLPGVDNPQCPPSTENK